MIRLRNIIKALTRRERITLIICASTCVISAFLLTLSAYYGSTTLLPAVGGSYTEGLVGQPTYINPILGGTSEADRDLAELLFADALTLSESHAQSDGGKTWNLVLKNELRWSDGEPLTTDDLLFTIETIQDVAARSPLLPTWQGVVVERISEREARFTLKSPYAFFENNLKELRIIPRHIFGSIPAANLRLSNYNLEPVGSGAYSFARYDKRKDGFLTDYYLTANANFAGTRAFITDFHVKFFSSPDEMIAAFNRFDVDGFGGIEKANLSALDVGYRLSALEVPRYYAIFLNPSLHVALKERDVRRALMLGTNAPAIAEAALGDASRAVSGPIVPQIEGYDVSVYKDAKFSLEEAQKLLDNAGWVLGSSGVREKVFGRSPVRMEFDLIVPQIPFLVQTANAIKDDWAKIGVKVTPIIMTPADINERVIKTRNYQMLLFGNILKNSPDIFAFWHSSERFYPGLNLAVYENKKVDALLEGIRKDPDPASRAANLRKLQSAILEDAPALFLYSPNYLYVSPKNLGGFSESLIATPANRFDHVAQWYVKTQRVFKKT